MNNLISLLSPHLTNPVHWAIVLVFAAIILWLLEPEDTHK